VIAAQAAPGQQVDFSKASTSELIDDLALIDSEAPGMESLATYGGFIGGDSSSEFQGGVLGVPPPGVPPPMRELARRGVEALPALIDHLGDARPTKLKVGNDGPTGFFTFAYFSNEYDPRVRRRNRPRVRDYLMRHFKGQYTVKVGDVCFGLIGQIVNRHLLPVRYQPSAGLVVNSPIEVPVLIEKVKKDWGNPDSESLKASLLADIRAGKDVYLYKSAFTRLRFYYPDTYNTLQGSYLNKKQEFEADAKATTE
jgi:hypothetical protein